jgi:NAD-dependent SIR2 family protein deacetylase
VHPPQILVGFIRERPRVFILTGAGISTASGIPGYRDADGNWHRKPPVTHQEFVGSEAVRRRYWVRSLLGWPMIASAVPNPAHDALSRLERLGHVAQVITQNVDGLHQRAGSESVIDLHGRLDRVVCLDCGAIHARSDVQASMLDANPAFANRAATIAPDGDADLQIDFRAFRPPDCARCAGTLKPDVVFFGASVPRPRVEAAFAALDEADAMLVVGSSLMAYSGYRFCERARAAGKPIAAINRGRTRADGLFQIKVDADCGTALTALVGQLAN